MLELAAGARCNDFRILKIVRNHCQMQHKPRALRKEGKLCMCMAGGDCKKHGTVINSTFELEVVPGVLEAMLLLYYEFGCLTNSTRYQYKGHFGACHRVVMMSLFLFMDQLGFWLMKRG